MRRMLALFAAATLALALAAPAAATRGQAAHAVPFQMQTAGLDRPLEMAPGVPPDLDRSTFGGRCSQPSDWVTTIDSTGVARHLGAVSVLNSHCTQFDFRSAPPMPGTFEDGRMTVTAANGDELWVEYSGSFLFWPGDRPDAGTSEIVMDQMTIVGGTGRFVHASGSLHGTALDEFGTGADNGEFSGWILYSASDRAG
ncbi:MAG TPA: hypothetical protein VFS32_06520 [Candidatus Limnocylindrales bacterium]|nr:hypothetical protein [Candidatus Limnocylindrales bacterium]